MRTVDVLALVGSLRAASLNRLLVDAAVDLAPSAMAIEAHPSLRAIPPYDEDLDTSSPPAAVTDLRSRIAAADGLLLATPEYNFSIPGVLKNALDWASSARPSVLAGKPVAVMGASVGLFGTVRAQRHLREVLFETESLVVGKPEVMVARAHTRFDEDGRLVDGPTAGFVAGLLEALLRTIREHHRAAAA